MAERVLCMHEVRGSMPLSSIFFKKTKEHDTDVPPQVLINTRDHVRQKVSKATADFMAMANYLRLTGP